MKQFRVPLMNFSVRNNVLMVTKINRTRFTQASRSREVSGFGIEAATCKTAEQRFDLPGQGIVGNGAFWSIGGVSRREIVRMSLIF